MDDTPLYNTAQAVRTAFVRFPMTRPRTPIKPRPGGGRSSSPHGRPEGHAEDVDIKTGRELVLRRQGRPHYALSSAPPGDCRGGLTCTTWPQSVLRLQAF